MRGGTKLMMMCRYLGRNVFNYSTRPVLVGIVFYNITMWKFISIILGTTMDMLLCENTQ